MKKVFLTFAGERKDVSHLVSAKSIRLSSSLCGSTNKSTIDSLSFSLEYSRDKSLKALFFNSQKIWDQNKTNINHIFSHVFNLDCAHLFNNMVAEISLNPICPRNIRKQSYSVAWGGDETSFLKTSLHEMIHFVWFYIWKKHFKDKWNEYEAPNIKWILSELVIDTIVKNTDINLIFPQPHKEKPAYQYFYNMKIGDNFILTELSKLYHDATNITIFMEQAYQYCLSNEELIRKQML